MTAPDLPYTDADLRAEAARQLALSAEDPDFMGIGERMEGADIASTIPDGAETGRQWDDLAPHEFDAAQREIDRFLTSAADLSEWAVDLGADGLEPTGYVLNVGSATAHVARIHFAFAPGMPDDARASLVEGLAQVIADHI